MQGMIWAGAGVTLLGVVGLGWSIRLAAQVRQSSGDPEGLWFSHISLSYILKK